MVLWYVNSRDRPRSLNDTLTALWRSPFPEKYARPVGIRVEHNEQHLETANQHTISVGRNEKGLIIIKLSMLSCALGRMPHMDLFEAVPTLSVGRQFPIFPHGFATSFSVPDLRTDLQRSVHPAMFAGLQNPPSLVRYYHRLEVSWNPEIEVPLNHPFLMGCPLKTIKFLGTPIYGNPSINPSIIPLYWLFSFFYRDSSFLDYEIIPRYSVDFCSIFPHNHQPTRV